MNKITSIASITIIMTLIGCKTLPDNNNSKIVELTEMYKKLHQLGDDQSCIYTLQNILFLDSSKTQYYDSLVFHYAKAGNFKATEKMIAKSLSYGKNIKVMEYSALIEGQKGDIETAISKLDELFALTNDYKYKISIFNMNLELGNVKSAESLIKELESLENLDSISIEQLISETETQTVPLKAALALGKGQIEAYAKNNLSGALKYIKQALEIKPDFQNALGLREKIIQATQQRR
jgi:tetratricopeptide (TPR) repeat protein